VLVTAKADYAVRAVVELAAVGQDDCVSAESIAARTEIPRPFLIKILQQLRMAGLTETTRGADGGHRLARDPAAISLGDVMRAVEGPLASPYGAAPGPGVTGPGVTGPGVTGPAGTAAPVARVWAELHRRVEDLLENVSIADILADAVPLPTLDRDRIPIT
jgi:Rrf2 family protein